MPSPEDRGQKIREGLRRAVQRGRVLGGLRQAREQENQQIHLQALRQALDYRDTLDMGREKSLSALSRDLFAAGCATSKGKPLTPEMVRRLRARLEEALLAMARGELQDNSADWNALPEIRTAIQQRNSADWNALPEIRTAIQQRNSANWNALPGISTAIQQRNGYMLVWHLKMIRKEKGATFADRVVRSLMGSEHAPWVCDALRQA
jgi:hypothetical protein